MTERGNALRKPSPSRRSAGPPLQKGEAWALRASTLNDHLIQKIRYVVPLPDGHTGELDVFDGVLKGLQFIEVEFSSEEDAEGFVPPEWFGDNVSDDKRYSNSFLSKCENLDVFEEK